MLDVKTTPDTPLADTAERICKGLDIFTLSVGEPTLIIFQAMLWDIFILKKHRPRPEPMVAHYRRNIEDRLADIARCKGPQSVIALRTVPRNSWDGDILNPGRFNAVVRDIAAERHLPPLDFDKALRRARQATAKPSRERDIFRDHIHPLPAHCEAAAHDAVALATSIGACDSAE